MFQPNDRVKVNATRNLANADLPLWCNGMTGTVVRLLPVCVAVKLDGVSAFELLFLPKELEKVQ